MTGKTLNAIYVTASRNDARFTRICVASIRHFYPDAPIRLLVGGPLEPGLEAELQRYWDVRPADVARGPWGWGFVKLEPLFGPAGECFMVVDSDTVFAGAVLEPWVESRAEFLFDDERQSEVDTHRLYYDWRQVRSIDARAQPPEFVFNTGQWFGTAGVLQRADFAPWIQWDGIPPRICHPGLFRNGEQGLLNYVVNCKAASGEIDVARRKIMHWPGWGMDGFTSSSIADKLTPAVVIHWAGFKGPRLTDMPGTDVLTFFERQYYRRVPHGAMRRRSAAIRYPTAALAGRVKRRLGLA